jgi:murein DD-endopeptidase MepM/ murein hydrolase activator NlpD
MSAEEATDEPIRAPYRPLPSVKMPLLAEQRRASRLRRLAVVLGGLLVTASGVTLAVLFHKEVAATAEKLGSWLSRPAADEDDGSVVPYGAPAAALAGGPKPYAPPSLTGEPPAAAAASEDPEDGETAEGDAEEDAEDDGPELPRTVTQDDGTVRHHRAFGDAPFFRAALERAGLSPDECSALEGALAEVMDFRRCRPDDELVVVRAPDRRLARFEYHPGPTHYYRARRGDDGFVADQVDVPVEVTRVAAGGRVRTSLGEALVDAGLGRSLVGRFVEAFQGKANFTRDTREGDVFRIIVDERFAAGTPLGYGEVHAVEYLGARTGELRAYWYERRGEGDFYDDEGRSVHGSWLRTPVRYERISSLFNPRRMHPILKRIVPHNGVDYAASTGTPVWAGAGGRVTWAGHKGANGNMVAIRHDGGFETFYCHLSRIAPGVDVGDRVSRQDLIGYVGSTGRSTGPHLHFGLKRGGRWVDPLEVIEGPGRLLPPGARAVFLRRAESLRRELRGIEVAGPAPSTATEGSASPGPSAEPPADEAMD